MYKKQYKWYSKPFSLSFKFKQRKYFQMIDTKFSKLASRVWTLLNLSYKPTTKKMIQRKW